MVAIGLVSASVSSLPSLIISILASRSANLKATPALPQKNNNDDLEARASTVHQPDRKEPEQPRANYIMRQSVDNDIQYSSFIGFLLRDETRV